MVQNHQKDRTHEYTDSYFSLTDKVSKDTRNEESVWMYDLIYKIHSYANMEDRDQNIKCVQNV